MHPAVKIYRYTEILAAAFSNGCNTGKHRVDFVVTVYHLELFGSVHLNRFKSGVHFFLCRLAHIRRTVAADPGIYLHFIPALTA